MCKEQTDLFSEIIVDNFAGGGGASTGIELATGVPVTIAINHDPDAILMHKTNHPFTEHYQASVWDISPVVVCRGRPVGLAWFSPDCFVAGTLILTKDGYKPIEEIRVGDLVLTHKGKWRPVVETMTSEKPVYKVRGYGNPGLVCSGKHPFYTTAKLEGLAPAFKEAKDLEPGKDYWGIPAEMISPIWDAPEDGINYDLAWLAGRYVGDGWLRMDGGHYETVITCGEQDIESLRAELAEHTPSFKWNFRRVRTGGQFTHCGKALCLWLNDNFGRLSDKKTIPVWLYTAPERVRADFIDGYMSADGWEGSGLREASTVSKRLAYGLVQLLATMGRPATVYYAEQKTNVIEGRKVNVKPIWRVKWRKKIAENHEQHFTRDGIIWRPVREVTDLHRTETVYNIGVADDESYVAEGVIVHNCKHFSKAKGAALVDRNIRGLAWIVLRWAGTVRPRVIILENVEEFVTWGPVRKGKPVKKLAGTTFNQWKRQLENLGYKVEHRELVAADYGAPTIRKRFVLVARCDGKPIVWPEPTHSENGAGGKMRWRSAAEIIDWSLPMYSIFAGKKEIKEKYGVNVVRPLADNTMRRTIRGVDKFTIKSGNPFLVECNHSGDGHISDLSKPIGTITAKHTEGLCVPLMAPVTFSNTSGSVGSPADKPVHTITSDGKQVLTAAQLIQYHTEQTENVRAAGLNAPMQTIDSSNRYALVSANLVEYFSTGRPIDITEPMHTVTSHDREALTAAHLVKYYGGVVGSDVSEPLPTVTAIDHNALCASHIAEFKGQDIGQNLDKPLRTITAGGGEFAAVSTVIQKYSPGADVGYWPEIRKLLNKYCGYTLADDEIILLNIGGTLYYIRDILLRMLSPHELYAAMGFPSDYIIDRDYLGNEYGKTKQVARCGNAVCPPMAEAVVRANYEPAKVKITTMAELNKLVSA